MLCLTHTPYQGAWTILSHGLGNLIDLSFRHTTSLFYVRWSPLLHHLFADLVHAIYAVVDVLLILPTVIKDVIQHAKKEWNICSRTNPHILIRFGCGTGVTRINHNYFATVFFSMQKTEHGYWMCFSRIRANVQGSLGIHHVVIAIGHRTIAPGVCNTGNRCGVANTRLMVCIVGSKE